MDYAAEEVLNDVTIKYVPAKEWIENTLKRYGYA